MVVKSLSLYRDTFRGAKQNVPTQPHQEESFPTISAKNISHTRKKKKEKKRASFSIFPLQSKDRTIEYRPHSLQIKED